MATEYELVCYRCQERVSSLALRAASLYADLREPPLHITAFILRHCSCELAVVSEYEMSEREADFFAWTAENAEERYNA